MLLFAGKMDPIVKMKVREKDNKIIPVIITLKGPPTNRFRNSISKYNGKIKYEYKHLNGIAAQISLSGADRLSELPEVAHISYDRKAEICMDKASKIVGVDFNAPYQQNGKGVNIAVIDTGVYPHGDLVRPHRALSGFKDFINSISDAYDDNGHGTHICGVIAGSGALSDGKYRGIAPGAKIVMLKAFSSVGEGAFSDIIAAIDWTVENKEKYNLKILCLPFGCEAIVPPDSDPLSKACSVAWDKGLIVVAASGNKGPLQGTITTPGICPSIITSGCVECSDINIRKWKIADFSSRGVRRETNVKPELVAPGVQITSLASDISYIPGLSRLKPLETPYRQMTGSSVSCGIAAACVALLVEKMPGISGNDMKGILKLSCTSLNELKSSQGYGVINLAKTE